MYRLYAFACYLQVIILFILIIFPVRRETSPLCFFFLELSPKFIFSPDKTERPTEKDPLSHDSRMHTTLLSSTSPKSKRLPV